MICTHEKDNISKLCVSFIKLIVAVSIFRLVSSLKLLSPERITLRKSFEFKEAIAMLMLFKLIIRVARNDKLFWQRRKQCSTSSISREHEHNGFKVSPKLCLNLCSLKWLKSKRNLLNNLTSSRS